MRTWLGGLNHCCLKQAGQHCSSAQHSCIHLKPPGQRWVLNQAAGTPTHSATMHRIQYTDTQAHAHSGVHWQQSSTVTIQAHSRRGCCVQSAECQDRYSAATHPAPALVAHIQLEQPCSRTAHSVQELRWCCTQLAACCWCGSRVMKLA